MKTRSTASYGAVLVEVLHHRTTEKYYEDEDGYRSNYNITFDDIKYDENNSIGFGERNVSTRPETDNFDMNSFSKHNSTEERLAIYNYTVYYSPSPTNTNTCMSTSRCATGWVPMHEKTTDNNIHE